MVRFMRRRRTALSRCLGIDRSMKSTPFDYARHLAASEAPITLSARCLHAAFCSSALIRAAPVYLSGSVACRAAVAARGRKIRQVLNQRREEI
jgi:hypothetical protein